VEGADPVGTLARDGMSNMMVLFNKFFCCGDGFTKPTVFDAILARRVNVAITVRFWRRFDTI
jgi:hypothetical protein